MRSAIFVHSQRSLICSQWNYEFFNHRMWNFIKMGKQIQMSGNGEKARVNRKKTRSWEFSAKDRANDLLASHDNSRLWSSLMKCSCWQAITQQVYSLFVVINSEEAIGRIKDNWGCYKSKKNLSCCLRVFSRIKNIFWIDNSRYIFLNKMPPPGRGKKWNPGNLLKEIQ